MALPILVSGMCIAVRNMVMNLVVLLALKEILPLLIQACVFASCVPAAELCEMGYRRAGRFSR